MRKFKKAFTLIELVMVIVVIAILAYNAIPDYKRNNRAEAINHILTMIRYTQNLALHDDKHSATDTRWQRSYWRFGLYQCSAGDYFYYIGTKNDKYRRGRPGLTEVAVDPANGKWMMWIPGRPCPTLSSLSQVAVNNSISPNIFITQKYGINQITFRGGCATNNNRGYVAFDNLGRPFRRIEQSNRPDYRGYIRNDCQIDFGFEDGSPSFTIVIPAESGFAYLQENPKL